MERSRPRLPAHEWAAVITFITILAFIVILNFVVNKRDAHLTLPAHLTNEIHITLDGAVATPKTVKVKQGTKLTEIIEEVDFLDEADLSSVDFEKPRKHDQIIVIPSKKMMTVFLEGDVSPKGAYTLETDSSLSDLYHQLGKPQPSNNRKLIHEEVLKF